MAPEFYWWFYALVFVVGAWLGTWAEARMWREKGDHEYLNTKESAGRLYVVKHEPLA